MFIPLSGANLDCKPLSLAIRRGHIGRVERLAERWGFVGDHMLQPNGSSGTGVRKPERDGVGDHRRFTDGCLRAGGGRLWRRRRWHQRYRRYRAQSERQHHGQRCADRCVSAVGSRVRSATARGAQHHPAERRARSCGRGIAPERFRRTMGQVRDPGFRRRRECRPGHIDQPLQQQSGLQRTHRHGDGRPDRGAQRSQRRAVGAGGARGIDQYRDQGAACAPSCVCDRELRQLGQLETSHRRRWSGRQRPVHSAHHRR